MSSLLLPRREIDVRLILDTIPESEHNK